MAGNTEGPVGTKGTMPKIQAFGRKEKLPEGVTLRKRVRSGMTHTKETNMNECGSERKYP